MELVINYISHIITSEFARVYNYHGVDQALYAFYLLSGIVLPFGHFQRWKKLKKGTSGIGDTCISSEVYMAFWRLAPLLYSFTVIASFPLFLSVFLDLLGRIGVIVELHRSKTRSKIKEDIIAVETGYFQVMEPTS